ncbi:ThiF family adenylyltransferase [Bacteriovorax sp. Seq25_V]|uniref:tRNA threonylcarbamoyladenosine dehydratase n=1 Tax=Bacteriovorax sp. Seq25_V TaxID=1201288 RepID=UPI00038A23A8|nr:tRNA threonylcarbamoyladenosine dehydratase [Bacteriovorax sp. Seq25_V]EQC43323.1 ThiF family protein [Bacteriovorax sp. Seq25_V]
METIDLRFKGYASLVGEDKFARVANSKILIIGLGGVGTWTVESLARSGVGTIALVDLDDICVSNTNRQVHAHEGNYGKFKIDALEERIKLINPDCKVIKHHCFFNKKNVDEIFSNPYDVVIDAMDSVGEKSLLINTCYTKNIPVICAGGAGGKVDPRAIEIQELGKTKNDMLLKNVRKKLRKDYRFPIGRARAKVQCVYSHELGKQFEVCEIEKSTVKLDCEGGLGSAAHITGIFGLMLSSLALEICLKDKDENEED